MSNIIEGITKDLKAIPKNLKTKVGDMDCQHFFRQIFLGYFPDIVQAFERPFQVLCKLQKLI